MSVTTLEGVVENGHIRLLSEAELPEKARVYVVVPGLAAKEAIRVASPRLVHREQARDFEKTVFESLAVTC